ncbi:MAG: hypothetical protein R6W92_00545 [Desulfocurvibacter africanus]
MNTINPESAAKQFKDALQAIRDDKAEREFLIKNEYGSEIQVPYSYIQDNKGKLDQIVRLLRKGVNVDVILAFYDHFMSNHDSK